MWGKVYLINRDPAVARLRAQHANRLLRDCGTVDGVICPIYRMPPISTVQRR